MTVRTCPQISAYFDFISLVFSRLRNKMSTFVRIHVNSKTRQQTRQQAFPVTKHSKAYWLPRIFRPVVRGKETPHYCVRMSRAGIQRKLSLQTPNREAAALMARDWFIYLSAHGWAAFDAKYRKSAERADSDNGTAVVPSGGKTN